MNVTAVCFPVCNPEDFAAFRAGNVPVVDLDGQRVKFKLVVQENGIHIISMGNREILPELWAGNGRQHSGRLAAVRPSRPCRLEIRVDFRSVSWAHCTNSGRDRLMICRELAFQLIEPGNEPTSGP